MNYYEQKKRSEWHLEQLKEFKNSEAFLQSESVKALGRHAVPTVWFGRNGTALITDTNEEFSNVATPWEDWKQNNYSPVEELKYNNWVEEQKETFKKTQEYKHTDLANFIDSAICTKNIPADDGIEVHEDGTIELCTGEYFENAVKPLNEFEIHNHYMDKKLLEWEVEGVEAFRKSKTFLESEAFEKEGFDAELVAKRDGSIEFYYKDKDSYMQFPWGMKSWKDWKKENYSEKEELEYNKHEEAKIYPAPDPIVLKPSPQEEKQEPSYGPDIEETIDTSADKPNYYEAKKFNEWDCEQAALFEKSESFKNSEAFKHQGSEVEIVVEYDGSVILTNDGEKEIFSDAVMTWEDWKKENCSEQEELEYNKLAALKEVNPQEEQQGASMSMK